LSSFDDKVVGYFSTRSIYLNLTNSLTMMSPYFHCLKVAISLLAFISSSTFAYADDRLPVKIKPLSFDCPPQDNSTEILSNRRVIIQRSWCGQVPRELRSAAPTSGWIDRQRDWTALWKTYRPSDPVPKIDFKHQTVLVYVHTDSNTVYINPMLNNRGEPNANISFTEAGSPPSPCT
jgi:hypothetical protein